MSLSQAQLLVFLPGHFFKPPIPFLMCCDWKEHGEALFSVFVLLCRKSTSIARTIIHSSFCRYLLNAISPSFWHGDSAMLQKCRGVSYCCWSHCHQLAVPMPLGLFAGLWVAPPASSATSHIGLSAPGRVLSLTLNLTKLLQCLPGLVSPSSLFVMLWMLFKVFRGKVVGWIKTWYTCEFPKGKWRLKMEG